MPMNSVDSYSKAIIWLEDQTQESQETDVPTEPPLKRSRQEGDQDDPFDVAFKILQTYPTIVDQPNCLAKLRSLKDRICPSPSTDREILFQKILLVPKLTFKLKETTYQVNSSNFALKSGFIKGLLMASNGTSEVVFDFKEYALEDMINVDGYLQGGGENGYVITTENRDRIEKIADFLEIPDLQKKCFDSWIGDVEKMSFERTEDAKKMIELLNRSYSVNESLKGVIEKRFVSYLYKLIADQVLMSQFHEAKTLLKKTLIVPLSLEIGIVNHGLEREHYYLLKGLSIRKIKFYNRCRSHFDPKRGKGVLNALTMFKSLHELDVSSVNLLSWCNFDFPDLKDFNQLKILNLTSCDIDNNGIMNLPETLEELHLSEISKLTDDVVDTLIKMTSLKKLYLKNSPLSPEAVVRIKETLKEVEIIDYEQANHSGNESDDEESNDSIFLP